MTAQVTLKSGEKVKVNDHVYCSPPWSVRDGTPYSVARIMEFLPPEGAGKGKGKGKEIYTRVRLAWYYRPSDVSDRPVADSRLLLAAIYSEICDINQLRSRCHVLHRDKITDLAGWKKRPDRFYFNRLFDPYIKKEFDVIQATDVRNLPDNIRQVLTSRYEYVVAEKEVVPDLTDTLRLCATCSEWCANPDTVGCDRCKNFFHMSCVQPPLLAKPSRGYGWTCAPCSKRHEEEVDKHDVRHPTPITKPKSNAPAPRGRGRPRKDRSLAEKEENVEIKYFKMWPFRYFGQYTVAEDTLDPDDLIFPRSATRVGPKYQATVPTTLDVPSPSDPEQRGGDYTVEVLSAINTLTDEEIAEMEAWKVVLSRNQEKLHSVDWLTEALRRFSQAHLLNRGWSTVDMSVIPTRPEKWKKGETRHTDREWTTDEVTAFEEGIFHYGAELRAVHDEIGTRSMAEVVRFYGHWKNSRLKEENAQIRAARLKAKDEGKDEVSSATAAVTDQFSDDEGSIMPGLSRHNNSCGACRTRESENWWRAPKGLATDILCDTCGTNWRKYADLNFRTIREDALPSSKKGSDKREGTPLNGPSTKRVKTSTSASVNATPPPSAPMAPQLRCLACQKNGPVGKVLKCNQCQFRVHAASCGVHVDKSAVESWICDICQNKETLESSMHTDCLLCPRRKSKKKTQFPNADSFLRASKPTEGQGWAHVLCAVFTPEISFSDVSQLRLIEGISSIPKQRWASKCTLCGETSGAVIRCSDCAREYHSSCAWRKGHHFGFEIQPVRHPRRDGIITTFKGETGNMVPIVCCQEHENSKRQLYDICETDETGETALQVYCRIYKQAPVTQAHALLRKARRLDQTLNIRTDASVDVSAEPALHCDMCSTQYSPAFYPSEHYSGRWRCHKCHFGHRNGAGHSPDGSLSPLDDTMDG
ncbi:hypothetical protein BDR04DRAFT_1091037 [Suillus decipiens]|nr:hypothetical protein BDR04DRAFT_1091037 [Suillus decipiens]